MSDGELILLRRDQARNAKVKNKRKEVQVKWADAVIPASWTTHVDQWRCSCPAYLFSRFLMCKHLVREVNSLLRATPPLKNRKFWSNLRRYHGPPYYRLQGIHQQLPDPGSFATLLQSRVAPSGPLLSTGSQTGLVPNSASNRPEDDVDQDEFEDLDDIMNGIAAAASRLRDAGSSSDLVIDPALLVSSAQTIQTRDRPSFQVDLETDEPHVSTFGLIRRVAHTDVDPPTALDLV